MPLNYPWLTGNTLRHFEILMTAVLTIWHLKGHVFKRLKYCLEWPSFGSPRILSHFTPKLLDYFEYLSRQCQWSKWLPWNYLVDFKCNSRMPTNKSECMLADYTLSAISWDRDIQYSRIFFRGQWKHFSIIWWYVRQVSKTTQKYV